LPGGRGEIVEHGRMTIVHDGYNANPDSFRSAIALAAAMRAGRRLVVVAGTMRELGTESDALHREVAEALAGLAPEVLALVGDFVPAFAPWREAFRGELLEAVDAETMGPRLAPRLQEGDLILLKGSRGTALERILPAILARAPSA
jgi:UDP-N-acetylmuramoyl-tripeptide--D-alanyl-D-alanine ligase